MPGNRRPLPALVCAMSLCVCAGAGRAVADGTGGLRAADLTRLDSIRMTGGEPVVLAEGGRPRLPIVAADDARAVGAALQLADIIRRIVGERPCVMREFAGQFATNTPALFVGDVAAARLAGLSPDLTRPDSFRVVVQDGSVFFLGRADYAVFDWCERQLGVRCYGFDAGDDGLSVPDGDRLSADAVDYSDSPVYLLRRCGSQGGELWSRFAKAGGTHRGGVSVHAPHRWHEDAELVASSPEVFARTPDGKRAASPLLCYGNPAALAYYERRIDEHIAGVRDSGGIVDTRRKVITVSPWDVAYCCTCGHCAPLMDGTLGEHGYASPVVWGSFLKRLAGWAKERHPDYLVSFLPYWNMCAVPAGLDLRQEGNCEAEVCVMPGLALMKNDACREREERLARRWAEVTGRKVLLWHYTCWPEEYTFAPYLFGETIRRHFSRMRDAVDGCFICASGARPRMTLAHYVWMRCLWNPEIDVGAVYDGFARRMFGPAASPMRRLIDLQEAGWSRQWPDDTLQDGNVHGISYPPDVVDEMKRLLVQAERDAMEAPQALWRVRRYASQFRRFFEESAHVASGARPPAVDVARAEPAPLIDGRLDDGVWQVAARRDLVPAFGEPGATPWAPTTAMAAWTDEGVTFAFRSVEPALGARRRDAAQGDTVLQDALDILLSADASRKGSGMRLSLDLENRLCAFADNVPCAAEGVRTGVFCGDGFWSAEVFVPFCLVSGGDGGRRELSVNMVRLRVGDAWLPQNERVEGSRVERSRLCTRWSPLDSDCRAFVPLRFAGM